MNLYRATRITAQWFLRRTEPRGQWIEFIWCVAVVVTSDRYLMPCSGSELEEALRVVRSARDSALKTTCQNQGREGMYVITTTNQKVSECSLLTIIGSPLRLARTILNAMSGAFMFNNQSAHRGERHERRGWRYQRNV